jgi:hypothetical protein
MQRQPSLHITKNHLILVLKSVRINGKEICKNYNELADSILTKSRQFSLTNRSIIVDKAKLLNSSSKVVLSTRDDAGVFAQLLNLIRKQRKHRGISLIKVGSKDWLMIKEIAKLALDFCNDFNLKREEGFRVYINIGLDKITKFNLSRFNSIHQNICDEYDAIEKIKMDMTPNQTLKAINYYQKYLGEKTGIVNDFSKEPSKMIHFINAKNEANKLGISIEQYIQAQFKGLEWANTFPDPSQLVSKGSIDRLNKFLISNNIKPSHADEKELTKKAGNWLKKKWSKNDRDKGK